MRTCLNIFAQDLTVALLIGSGAVFAQDSGPARPAGQPKAVLQVTVANRNAAPLLALVMKALANLQTDPKFEPALSRMTAPTLEESNCLASVRKDPSGLVFDAADCVKVWPQVAKAAQPKLFEETFAQKVGAEGIAAFPAVRVTPFEFQQRMQLTQFPNVAEPKLQLRGGTLEPTDEFKKILCNSNITFVDLDRCHVKVVPRLGIYQDDLYVPQTGYRVRLLNAVEPQLAAELRSALLEKLNLPKGTPRDAVGISIFRSLPANPEKLVTDASLVLPNDTSIEALWNSMGTDPEALNITRGASPPTILVFDSQDLEQPLSITDWLRDFSGASFGALSEDCSAKSEEAAHSDAVASLLFPGAMLANVKRGNGPAAMIQLPPESWNGALLSPGHFRGSVPVSEAPWYERNQFSQPGDPLVGLVVYSRAYDRNAGSGDATLAATKILNDPSTLLIVAAPQRSKVPSALDFGRDLDPRVEPDALEQACLGRAWPACLGRHPRVLVVAPTIYPEVQGQGTTLANAGGYILGASTVRIAAPGANVPIFSRCAAQSTGNVGGDRIGVGKGTGTSFAAPLVALVVSRLIQIGPEQLRTLPEAAIWRVLSTTNPLRPDSSSSDPWKLTEFGKLDAGRALRGASYAEYGPENAATLYEASGDGKEMPSQAVIMPYPWNDQPGNIGEPKNRMGMRVLRRNVITYSQPSAGRTETIYFERLLRIVRSAGERINGNPPFDIFYVSDPEPTTGRRAVIVRKQVRLGSGNYVESPGYCRSDGMTVPDSPNAKPQSQAQPACLYAWRTGSKQFEPLDLNKVSDIVFPPAHISAQFPGGVVPADLQAVVSPASPWAQAFCSTGPRVKTKATLKVLRQPEWSAVCTPK
ncbi:hypothetical protein [Polaromonas sp.]|uniref:hypothetical protein n=1 Tax=Polaromonas sp. TaxID=1869339 RepID=UPI003CC11349